MNAAHATRFPGATGLIPNFAGADAAARRLAAERVFERAQCIWTSSDACLEPLRVLALCAGKTLVVTGNLAAERCFLRVDPLGVPAAHVARAASADGLPLFASALAPEDAPAIDLAVCGCVGVDAAGGRLGTGAGRTDVAFALLRAAQKISVKTPVAAVAHALQVLRERLPVEDHDMPVDLIATEEAVIVTHTAHRRPAGLLPAALAAGPWSGVAALARRVDPGARPPGIDFDGR